MNAGREYDPATHYNPTHLRMDSLFFGVLLGYFYHFKSTWLAKIGSYRYTLLFAGMAMVLPMTIIDIRYSKFVPVFGFLMLYLGYGLILLAVIYTPLSEGILGSVLGSSFGRVLAFIGFFSYPIYLWHIDLARLPLQALARTGFLSVLSPTWRWIAFTLIYVTLATSAGVVLGLFSRKTGSRTARPILSFTNAGSCQSCGGFWKRSRLSGVKSTDPELVEVGS
jgi:peptidoglycan/LPS O-acetylase OafA/YrhL